LILDDLNLPASEAGAFNPQRFNGVRAWGGLDFNFGFFSERKIKKYDER
jgi:hypothetical protein